MRCSLLVLFAATLLAGCSSASSPSASPAMLRSAGRALPATHGYGNIYWNKAGVRLPRKGHAKAVLSYWAADGYYTEPNYCRNGGQFSATVHRSWGNRQRYMHVLYWFTAQTSQPDECAFTAVLNNTGSPPIAIINLQIR